MSKSRIHLHPAEQIIKPVPPADDADLEVWREYHRQMVAWIDWQRQELHPPFGDEFANLLLTLEQTDASPPD